MIRCRELGRRWARLSPRCVAPSINLPRRLARLLGAHHTIDHRLAKICRGAAIERAEVRHLPLVDRFFTINLVRAIHEE